MGVKCVKVVICDSIDLIDIFKRFLESLDGNNMYVYPLTLFVF